jgi:hypothetical protein
MLAVPHDGLSVAMSANPLTRVRLDRERRGGAVQWLLNQQSILFHRNNPIEWQLLGRFPNWINIDRTKREELFILAGAVLSVEQMRQWIDGALLQALATYLGELRLSQLLLIEPSWDVIAFVLTKPNSFKDELMLRGGAVLIQAVREDTVRGYLKEAFPHAPIKLSEENASLIASHALRLAQLSYSQLKDENVGVSS